VPYCACRFLLHQGVRASHSCRCPGTFRLGSTARIVPHVRCSSNCRSRCNSKPIAAPYVPRFLSVAAPPLCRQRLCRRQAPERCSPNPANGRSRSCVAWPPASVLRSSRAAGSSNAPSLWLHRSRRLAKALRRQSPARLGLPCPGPAPQRATGARITLPMRF
jgi:hypothetical protein